MNGARCVHKIGEQTGLQAVSACRACDCQVQAALASMSVLLKVIEVRQMRVCTLPALQRVMQPWCGLCRKAVRLYRQAQLQ